MVLSKQKSARHPTPVTAYFPFDEQRINYITHISDHHRVVYVETPKAGCTTIKRALQIIESGGEAGLAKNVHDRDSSPLKTPQTSRFGPQEIYTSPEMFRFCFVRNPYARVVSAYLDKFVTNKWEARRRLPKLGFAPDAEISLLQFLQAIAERRPEQMDIHWMPQTVLLQPDKVRYDTIGRLENFDADFSAIMRRMAPTFLQTYGVFNHSPHRTGAAERLAELVGPEEEALIRRIYADDFAVFGYDPAPPFEATPARRPARRAPDRKKRLLLHIGTHKTGTTSIQHWFANNGARLARQDAYYPDLHAGKRNPGQHFLAAAAAAAKRTGAPARPKRVATLIERLRAAPGRVAMVSSELLSLIDPAPIADIFAEFDCEVVCILRRQDEFLESMYRELVKSSFFAGDKDDFLKLVLAGEPLTIFTDNAGHTLKGVLPFDYAALLDRWAAAFGADKVHALAYDDDTRGADALAKTQRLMGLAEEPLTGGPRNVSLSAPIVQARSLIDRHLDWADKMALRPVVWKANDELARDDRSVIFGAGERRRIMQAAAPSNRRLARTYLKGVDVDWLGDQPAVTSRPAAPPLTADGMARISASIIAERNARIRALEKPRPGDRQPPAAAAKPTPAPAPIAPAARPLNGQLGLNFARIDTLLANPDALRLYLQCIEEINADAIRIPFYWRELLHYSDRPGQPQVAVQQHRVDKYFQFIELLPRKLKVLGCVVNCAPFVAEQYYRDQATLPDFYREYVGFIAKTFPFIDDIELWNEPNASDFYLSVPDRDGDAPATAEGGIEPHRPWSGAEFVRDVLVPGTAALRESGYTGGIVGVTFAENGIVGHGPRPPAFANTLAKLPDYAAHAKENARIGAFYFKAMFAEGLFAALKDRYPSADELPFDAFGIHPYPYFATGDAPFWQHSVELVRAFFDLQDRYGYGRVPVWATEVGARSLDLHNNYTHDADAQKAFVQAFAQGAGFGAERLRRIHWYKFNDQNWDLIQEKTFGLVDHYLHRKPAFYALKSMRRKVLGEKTAAILLDDFHYGLVHNRDAVDPDFWALDKSAPFSNVVCARPLGQEDARLLVFPGRTVDDWLSLTTLAGLPADAEARLALDLDLQLYAETLQSKASFLIEIALRPMGTAREAPAAVRIRLQPRKGTVSVATSGNDGGKDAPLVLKEVKPGQLTGISLRTSDGKITVAARRNAEPGHAEPLMDIPTATLAAPLRIALKFRRLDGPRGFLEVKRFRAARVADEPRRSAAGGKRK